MLFKIVAALGFAASSLALSITSPGPNAFWVQGTSNVINWSFSSGDPNPVDITVTNSNSSFLNGAFSIARNLDASNGSFTVTNVTLRVDAGYVVNFVNTTNSSQIFTSSGEFDVKKAGTTPVNSTGTASGSPPSATSSSGSSSSGSGTATQTSTRGAASSGAAVRTNAGGFLGNGILALAGSGLVALLTVGAML